ncbi:MAG TPA: DUF1553 domain-containing protein [Verrucomicrobiae bacterium]|nr:DUF1553 domain-containing protein [Verrucomicrobiae bacterium]
MGGIVRLLLIYCLCAQDAGAAAASNAGKLEYNRDIRPILAENCFACHGPDSASRKAGLRLDKFTEAVAPRPKSSPAIVPGKPADSELVRRITAGNPDDIMPPAKTLKTLMPQQKEILKRWIAQGAKYQPHWSLIAPVRPEFPKVHNHHWARNPIDTFILAGLESAGLKPAPEADRRTLVRRVSLDLTGLPPTPEEVEAFVKDTSPNAYEKLVDKLLASPHYGEHRGRYWLDAARYADTHGIHMDNFREMWTYRDWVIDAFNRNETFDQFTVEQLAGDLLPNHTLDQEIASGFNRCNITTSEGGAIDEEYAVFYARDRTETTSVVWLGLTAGCAVCHDHKFDPLSQKEFYSLSAFFNNTTQAAMDGNIKDTPPNIMVPMMEDRPRWQKLLDQEKPFQARIDRRRENGHADFNTWLPGVSPKTFSARVVADKPLFHARLAEYKKPVIQADSKDQTNKLSQSAVQVDGKGETNKIVQSTIKVEINGQTNEITLATNASWREGVVAAKAYVSNAKPAPEIPNAGDLEKDHGFSYGAWVFMNRVRDGAIFARMADAGGKYRGWDLLLQDGKPAAHLVHDWPEDALKVVANKAVGDKRWTHVCVTYDGSSKAAGMKIYIDGEVQGTTVEADKLKNTIHTTVPLKIGQRDTASILSGTGIQDIRIYGRTLKPEEVKSLAQDTRMAYLLAKPAEHRKDKEKDELYQVWLTDIDHEYQAATAAIAEMKKEEDAIKARGAEALVMHERPEAPVAYVLNRGEYDKRKDKVQPITPAALHAMPADYKRNRLGLARWLMLPENPLTARVTVNRFWQEIFGVGIVRTTGDFGITGELPSNQELLDWLAVDFRESGWDVKRLIKLFVTSAAYRQAALVTPAKLEKDADNRLLSRGPRFRMDAEMVRDYALAASGLLSPKIGGPSVKTYQPDGVWEAVAMIGSNTRDYKRDSGESLYRRSLYTFWKRAAPPASLEIFNAPSREACTVRRERTDTPLQALVTLNDPQFIEAARNLAEHALKKGGPGEKERLDFMAERLLARPLRPAERKITGGVLRDLLVRYKAAPKDAEALITVGESKADASLDRPTLAAYTMVANELMNLDEVLNK